MDDPPPPRQIERELLAATNFAFGLQNASRKGDNKISLLKTLTFSQVAQLMIHLHRVVAVAPSGRTPIPTTTCSPSTAPPAMTRASTSPARGT
ncbi:hypothetical protein [Tessaracoccus coleopterorum]|uniref:hypothetical protein n=1 Tax=Tessaracoccus coleopterorum TaxID=2714950 RepID=UPI0018D3E41A|nr:hypothetical protein [Tessaracoccus coleopterorum]